MRFSVITLGDHPPDGGGARIAQAQRYANLVDLAVWAEELGYDAFHVGEHHFCDYIVSNPVPVLAAAAMRTTRIRLSTAVTLLANRDPVLIAEDYAALDLLSGGRVELVVGRGNLFAACYRQMGQDLASSRALFEENLDLLLRLWDEEPVSSSGATRPPLDRARTQPRPQQSPHPPIWIGGGSSQDSARSAAFRGLAFQVPGVFAGAGFFRGLVDLYRAEFLPGRLGADAKKVGFTAHVYVGRDGAVAKRFWEPYHIGYLNWVHRIAAEGGMPAGPPPSFARNVLDPKHHTALCGDPDEVADRIAAWRDALGGLDALLLKFDGGGLPMKEVRSSMELFAARVAPHFR
jgi:alkanesulfonate monooxygenase SsuD/methylene tetrahydromethanopterin reductase-like flavin-dependent oxidoreductase (luciferase family)